jgi:hypothetical protein
MMTTGEMIKQIILARPVTHVWDTDNKKWVEVNKNK